ncbi:MAG TPA: hypothetical protein VKF82_01060 [Candidatus Eremiobacteraceae bacterium]|nr:hypothetical protein [Candidatus Eremiobacteraceae bacterium]
MARRDVCWLLIGAIALIASLLGHALQLHIESAHLFGTVRALYSHSLQTPFAYIAFGLLLVSALFIARGIIESVRDEFDGADWLLPALDAVRSISPGRLVAIVVGLQLTSLTVGELSEQALSSYDGFGLGAIFGPGHLSAPFVHIAVGAVLALALRAFARAACERVADIASFVLVVIGRLAQPAPVNCAPALRILSLRAQTTSPPLLARHIASRPPPVRAALVA